MWMSKIEWTNNIKKTFNKVLKSRTFKYGTNSIILIAAVVAIAVVFNILVDMTQIKWDLTPNKLYSIGDTTKKILKELDKDVTIYGLFDESRISSSSDKEFVELLDQYAKYSHVTVEYVDPDKNPGILKQIDPENVLKDVSKSAFVVKSGNKVKNLSYYDLFSTYFDQQTFQTHVTGSLAEQGFTGAIKYVTSEITPTIYFTTGHDEKDVDKNFTSLKDQLVNNNYDVKPVNLVVEDKVPEDTEILVVASPKKDLTISENGNNNGITTVNANYELSAYTAVCYLIENGHRDIAYISSSFVPNFYLATFEGYRKALEKAQVTIQPSWIQINAVNEESAYNCMKTILENKHKPTAVFCTTDTFAIGAMKCAKDMGFKVPEDISFIGIDDIFLSNYIEPKLSTIKIDKFRMGSLAMELIMDKIQGKKVNSVVVDSDHLVIRESVKCRNKGG
jgi:hypothetical protein